MLINKKRRLVASISLLLVSAILMGTASYAWFAMNTKTDVTGYDVEAYSDSRFLQIDGILADGSRPGFNNGFSYNASEKNLKLATYDTITDLSAVFKQINFVEILADTYYDGTGKFYEKADSDAGDGAYNFIEVEGLEAPTTLNGLVDHQTLSFVMQLTGKGDGSTKYYAREDNAYVERTPGTSADLYGLYAIYQYQLAKDETYQENTIYYTRNGKDFTQANVTTGENVAEGTYTLVRVNNRNFETMTNADKYAKDYDDAIRVFWDISTNNLVREQNLSYGSNLKGYYAVGQYQMIDIAAAPKYEEGITYYTQNIGYAEVDASTYTVGETSIPAGTYTKNGEDYNVVDIQNTPTYEADVVYYTQNITYSEIDKGSYEVDVTPIAAGVYTTDDGTVYTLVDISQAPKYSENVTYYTKSSTGTFTAVDSNSYITGTTPVAANTYTLVVDADNFDAEADGAKFNGIDLYYVKYYVESKAGYDYVCLGRPAENTAISNYIYWGRAYSTSLSEVQEKNTLNVMTHDVAKEEYYLYNTLYIRQAANTDHASNLRVSKITVTGANNALTPALRVLLVATSDTGERATVHYDVGTRELVHKSENGTEKDQLFATLLGDAQEVVTVEVYVFFDGRDEAAYNNNMGILNGQTVNIEFAIDELEYNKAN